MPIGGMAKGNTFGSMADAYGPTTVHTVNTYSGSGSTGKKKTPSKTARKKSVNEDK